MATMQSVSGAVAEDIEGRIRDEHLSAGFRIGTKTSLIGTYDVAPATLNEALRILRERKIVVVRPGVGGGIFVADQPPLARLATDISDLKAKGLIDVNSAVEVLDGLDLKTAHDAALFRTDADIQDLNDRRAELVKTWHTPRGEQTNWQLHRRIAEITPNRMLRSFYQNLVDYILSENTDPTLGVSGFQPSSDERLRIHLKLVDAIIAQDDEGIDAALKAHRLIKS